MRLIISNRLCIGALIAAFIAAIDLTSANAEPASSSLRIKVTGEISPSCSLTKPTTSSSFDIADSQTGGTKSSQLRLNFNIDCNGPFSLIMASRNGALTFVDPAKSASGFRTAIGYRASVTLPDALPGGNGCDSESMSRHACEQGVLAPDGALGDGHITLTVLPDPQPLLKGVYSDTLTLVARPRLGGDETL